MLFSCNCDLSKYSWLRWGHWTWEHKPNKRSNLRGYSLAGWLARKAPKFCHSNCHWDNRRAITVNRARDLLCVFCGSLDAVGSLLGLGTHRKASNNICFRISFFFMVSMRGSFLRQSQFLRKPAKMLSEAYLFLLNRFSFRAKSFICMFSVNTLLFWRNTQKLFLLGMLRKLNFGEWIWSLNLG